MQFEHQQQIWQIVEARQFGVIAVLVVEGRLTQRQAYFPNRVIQRQ